ncbi:MAG TPA: cation:proton antiporter [Meiothermus sp.]|nr:cation:proton antiporter [Meiothermus sp.]
MPLPTMLRRALPVVALGGWALAAGEGPAFFGELAALVVISAGIAFVSFRLGLVPIVSFLLAGVIIGPGALGIVRNPQLINAAAEIGVVLLLFTIGIEFSLERLARIARLIFVGGGLQVGLTLALTTGLLALLGVSWREGVFTGCLLALSSTAIVMKLLSDRGETNSAAGQASLGILIFQDLAVVAMVLVVPMLGQGGGAGGEVLWAFAKAAAIIALILTLARRVIPAFLEAVARTCSREVFLLVVIALCFGTAYLTSLAGLSLALGAFLAGLLVSESRFGQQALGEILPLQILFSAAFFISVGLLFDLSFMVSSPLLLLSAILGVLGLKVAVTALSTRVLGYPLAVSAQVGLLLAQVGEFSFVLERVGREAGLNAFGIPQEGSQVFVALTVLLMAATPFLANAGGRLRERVGAPAAQAPAPLPQVAHGAFDHLENHVILAGYGAYGRRLADALNRSGEPFLILTLSPDGANQAEEAGYPVLRGDYSNPHILGLSGVSRARLVVIPDDEPAMIHRVAAVVRANHPDLPILARTRFEEEVSELERAGVSQVLPEERLTAQELLARVMGAGSMGLGPEAPRPEAQPKKAGTPIRLNAAQLASANCTHLEWAHEVVPSTSVCADCQKLGDTWVHLRVCMTCGYVGCCDDSKNKHARQHFQSSGHPIIKSLEKGEGWAWCFVDEKLL